MPFKKIANWFIPDPLKVDIEKNLRAMNIVSIALLIFPIGTYYSILYGLNGFFIGMAALFFCSLLDLTAPFIVRLTGNLKWAGLTVNLSFFMAVFGLATVTGGIYSPSAVWFAAIPVLAILMNGKTSALIWSGVILVTVLAMHIADLSGHPLPDMLPYDVLSQKWKTMQVIANSLFVLFILLASLATEKARQRAFSDLLSSKEALQVKMGELEEAHSELGASEEELRQNGEMLRVANNDLESARQLLEETLDAEKSVSEALKKREAELSLLINTMKEGLVTVNNEGYITFANQSLCSMFGYSLDEVLARHPTDFLDEKNRRIFEEEYQKRQAGMTHSYEIEWLCKGGWTISTIVSPQAVYEEGLFSGSVAVLTDVTPLKKAQRKLEAREERLRAIFSSAAVGIAVISKTGIIEHVNESWTKLTGYTLEEAKGLDYRDLVHPSMRQDSWKSFQTLVEGQHQSYQTERQFLRKDGSSFWVSASPSCLLNARGDTESVLAVIIDITDQKKAEEALKESEEKFRMVLDKANEAIVVTVGNRIVLHNPKLEEITGCSKEELSNAPLSQFVHPEDWPFFAKRADLPAATRQKKQDEVGFFRLVNKEGEERWFGTVASQTEWEGNYAYQDMLEDIHDRQTAEQQLRNYEVIISTASELMALIDRDYVYRAVNKAYAHLLHLEKSEIIGKAVEEVLDASYFQDFLKEKLERCFEGETIRFQRWNTWEGQRLCFDVIYQPVIGTDGSISNLVVISKDITDIKIAEEKLSAKNKALHDSNKELKKTISQLKAMQSQLINSEKMASLGQLTAGIAHEINNPVNFISGNVGPLSRDLEELNRAYELYVQSATSKNQKEAIDMLNRYLEEIDMPYIFEEMKQLLEGVKEGANRTKDIVIGLRNFSRLDEDDIKKADINHGVNSTLTLLQNQMKHRITIHKNYGQLPYVECYPGKLNQVFMNILNNAQQAITGKGEIFISTQSKAEHVVISIRDTGEGMPNRVKARIFDPFFTTKEVGEGTGLGLSISYGIIQQHGGTIEVVSEKGKGTEFIITLPLRQKS